MRFYRRDFYDRVVYLDFDDRSVPGPTGYTSMSTVSIFPDLHPQVRSSAFLSFSVPT